MESLILAYSFAAALALGACVVALFSKPVDEALSRVVPAELAPAWSRYAKFALFTVTFAGGLRLTELSALLATRAPGGPPLTAGQGLLEVFRTIAGSLVAASGTLLAFFVATLAVRAAARAYESRGSWLGRRAVPQPHAAAVPQPQAAARPPIPGERPSVGAERHAAAKDRPRAEAPGRLP